MPSTTRTTPTLPRTPSATEAGATTPAAQPRDPWFDNAKMALVTLVVVGHSWVLLPASPQRDHLYDFLYAWHVPAFVFVTGYLSRSFAYTPARMWQLLRTVVVPYVVFEGALALFRVYVGGEHLQDLFRDPHWPMWYLSALFFWRLLTPVFRPLPGAVAVGVAVGVSLVAGAYAGDTLDLARVVGLLPFFVLGLHARREHLALLRTPLARVAGAVGLAGVFWVTRFTDRFASTEWLYYRSRYALLDVSDTHAMVIRAVVLTVGLIGAASFLSLVPAVGGWFSRMGAWTLVVYLFHGFAIKSLEYGGYPERIADHPGAAFVVTTLGAIGLALLLASPPVASRLQHAVDPLGLAEQRFEQAHAAATARRHADRLGRELRDRIADADHARAGGPLR